MQVDQRPIDSLIPYIRNSRTHSEEQVAQIAASLREFGWMNPVLVDGENGIIAGHGRVMAARKLGMDTVPCLECSHLTDTQKRAYIITDNKLALNAGWDDAMLAIELDELADMDFDLSLTGFDQIEIDGINGTSENESRDNSGQSYITVFEIAVECEHEEEQSSVYNMLTEKGYKCRVLSM